MAETEGVATKVAIGISFGNSYSSIAHTTGEGRAEVIANELGDRQIPSFLSYVAVSYTHLTLPTKRIV